MVSPQLLRLRKIRSDATKNGMCLRCGKYPPKSGRKMCVVCTEKRLIEAKAAWKKRRDKNPTNCSNCFVHPRMGTGALCERCFRFKAIERLRLKNQVVAAYGGKCECCQEDILHLLTIDHINGIKNEQREQYRTRGLTLWRRLRHDGYPPDGFQVLCMNCNWSKGVFGLCPHSADFPMIRGVEVTPRQLESISSTSSNRIRYKFPQMKTK